MASVKIGSGMTLKRIFRLAHFNAFPPGSTPRCGSVSLSPRVAIFFLKKTAIRRKEVI